MRGYALCKNSEILPKMAFLFIAKNNLFKKQNKPLFFSYTFLLVQILSCGFYQR